MIKIVPIFMRVSIAFHIFLRMPDSRIAHPLLLLLLLPLLPHRPGEEELRHLRKVPRAVCIAGEDKAAAGHGAVQDGGARSGGHFGV